jgi:hypothetical protein
MASALEKLRCKKPFQFFVVNKKEQTAALFPAERTGKTGKNSKIPTVKVREEENKYEIPQPSIPLGHRRLPQ